MTREQAATLAQSKADLHNRNWYVETFDGVSYAPTQYVPSSFAKSSMTFQPRIVKGDRQHGLKAHSHVAHR